MKLLIRLIVGSCLLAGMARAQDVMSAAAQHYRVLVDNEHVRVVECTLKPGEKDAWHTHAAGWFYVTKGGKMKVTYADGKTVIQEGTTGESQWSPAEAPHTSENIGTSEIGFILVEVKSAAGPTKKP